MSTEIELEKTYLAARLPDGLSHAKSEVIIDQYIPLEAAHPVIRLRRRGDTFELTKKVPVTSGDSSKQFEHTINLTADEYASFSQIPSKRLSKKRHYLKIDGHDAEVDVYNDDLAGLVVIDFEFHTEDELNAFSMLGYCLADVTQDPLIAAGKLAGKTYQDIKPGLEAYGYHPLFDQDQRS